MADIVTIPVKLIVDQNYEFTGVQCDEERRKAVNACYSSFFYYDSSQMQITSIVASLAKDHFFIDGNKRTALFTYILLSELNHVKYIENEEEQVQIFVELAASHKSLEEYKDMLFPAYKEEPMNFVDPAEYDAIVKVLQIYIDEGGVAGNVEGVKRAFHEKAVMNGSGKDGYVFGPIQNLYDLYEKVGGDPGTKCHVDVFDIVGNTAVARIVIKDWHGMDFVDFHELIKENGEWKIIAKTYQQIF